VEIAFWSPAVLAASEFVLVRKVARNEEYADNAGKWLLLEQLMMFHWLIDAQSGERTFDAGYGPGLFTEMCLQANAHVSAMDFSLLYCQGTRELIRILGEYHFSCEDLRALPFRGEIFDKIVCIEVLEHIPGEFEPQIFVQFHRVLSPGGSHPILHTSGRVVREAYARIGGLFPALLRSKRCRKVCCDPAGLRNQINNNDTRSLRRRLGEAGLNGTLETYQLAVARFGWFTRFLEWIPPPVLAGDRDPR